MTEALSDPRLQELDDLLEHLGGSLRAGRERLPIELLERGFSPTALRTAHVQDRLAVLLLDEALRESASLSARQLADACHINVDEVLRTSRLLGLTIDDADTPGFDESSCDAFRSLAAARAYGLSEAAIDELLTVLGRHMWQVAADLEVIVGNELGRPGDTEYELAHRYADAGRVLAPAAAPLVVCAFTGHLRERMTDIFVTPEEADNGALRAVADVAVAFVDVVGFTGLGERVDAGELKSVAMRLAGLADRVIDLPVRLVKTVGDAILLMSRDTTALVHAIVELNAAASAEGALPPLHCGVAYGPAYVGGADVYGAPVNLASRLTDLAPATRIWTVGAVVKASTDVFSWLSRGTRDIKGCEQPIEIFELAPA
jgi:adenylate cyclase